MSRDELRKLQNKFNMILTILVFIILISAFLLYQYHDAISDTLLSVFIILLIPLLPVLFLTWEKSVKLSAEIKKYILIPILEEKFSNVKYLPQKGFDKSFLKDMVNRVSNARYTSKDYLEATYNGTQIRYCYSKIEVDDGEGSSKVYFNGKVIEFDFPKIIEGSVTVSQPNIWDLFKKKSRIIVESVQFDNTFSVYSKDPKDAFYILTPHFMEKLININRIYCDKIGFKFKMNKIVLAINDGGNILGTYSRLSENEDSIIRDKVFEFIELINLLEI